MRSVFPKGETRTEKPGTRKEDIGGAVRVTAGQRDMLHARVKDAVSAVIHLSDDAPGRKERQTLKK